MFRKSIVLVAVMAVALVLLQVPSSYGRYGPEGGRGHVIIHVLFGHPWNENLSPRLSCSAREIVRSEIIYIPLLGSFGNPALLIWIVRSRTQDQQTDYSSTVTPFTSTKQGINHGLKTADFSAYNKRRP